MFTRLALLLVLLVSVANGFGIHPIVQKPQQAIAQAVTAAAITMAPLVAFAEEQDYEYGAVDAPIGLAIGGGIVAILTAGLPFVMQGGEEAFEEMKERDSDNWGTNKDILGKK